MRQVGQMHSVGWKEYQPTDTLDVREELSMEVKRTAAVTTASELQGIDAHGGDWGGCEAGRLLSASERCGRCESLLSRDDENGVVIRRCPRCEPIMPGKVQSARVTYLPESGKSSSESVSFVSGHMKSDQHGLSLVSTARGEGSGAPPVTSHSRIQHESLLNLSTPQKPRSNTSALQSSVTPSSLPPSSPPGRGVSASKDTFELPPSPFGASESPNTSARAGILSSVMDEFNTTADMQQEPPQDAPCAASMSPHAADSDGTADMEPGVSTEDLEHGVSVNDIEHGVSVDVSDFVKSSVANRETPTDGLQTGPFLPAKKGRRAKTNKNSKSGRGQYSGTVSRRGGRMGSPARTFVRASETTPAPESASTFSHTPNALNYQARVSQGRMRESPQERNGIKSYKDPGLDFHDSSPSAPQQASLCSSGMDVPSLASCSASSCSQNSPPRPLSQQNRASAKDVFADYSPNDKSSSSAPSDQKTKQSSSTNSNKCSNEQSGARQDNEERQGEVGTDASRMAADAECNVYCNEGEDSVENPDKNERLTCKERVHSPPTMVCFSEGSKGNGNVPAPGSHSHYQGGLSDLKLNSPCMFSPSNNMNVLDSPFFNQSTKLTPISGKSCLRSPNPRSSRGNGANTPTSLFETPIVMRSFDTPTAFPWLQSPSHGLIGDRGCGSTPVSHFFQQVQGLNDSSTEESCGQKSALASNSSIGKYSQICISPLAPSRRQGNPGSIFSFVKSPKSPARHTPKSTKSGKKAGDTKLDAHTAERDVMEDDDLSVLMKLAQSTKSGVFRSPVAEQESFSRFSAKDAQKPSLQLPMINSSNASGGSPKLARKPLVGSMNESMTSHARGGFQVNNCSSQDTRDMGREQSEDEQAIDGSFKRPYSSSKSNFRQSVLPASEKANGRQQGLILHNGHHQSQSGQDNFSLSGVPISRRHEGHMMGQQQLPPPVMARGGSISTVIGAGQSHGARSFGGPVSDCRDKSSVSYAAPGAGGTKSTLFSSGGPDHAQDNRPYSPMGNKRSLSSSGCKQSKKIKAASPQKKKPGKNGTNSSQKKMSSPPVDDNARTAAERQAAANANTPNANAAALAAAILRGVTMRPSGKWQAQLYYAGKSRYIGVFDTREKAALAYEIAREKLKADPKDTMNQTPEATEAKVTLARKAAFAGVNEPDPRPAKKK